MSRKQTIWIVMPMLLSLVLLYGCPKKKPVTKPTDLNVETTNVTPPPAGPTTDVKPPQAPAPTADQTEDPLLSQDLQVVNDELRRRGFSPDIFFDYDQSALTDDSRGKLSRNADLLKAQPRLSMTIEGHCDERGTSEYNLALGERRANAAKSYLSSLGVGADRMRTLSYGSERPVCTEHEESCWSQNRRDHMIITGRSNAG